MRFVRSVTVLMIAFAVLITLASAQERGGAGQRGGEPQRGGEARGGDRGGRGGGRGAAQTMTLVTTAWPDGGQIPLVYSQAGPELSPGIQWSNVPANTTSFVVAFRDLDTVMANGADGILQWLVWNIPATATGIQRGRPDGFELPDGSRQISISGSRYRGPGASANGPIHHYVLEVYALDTMLDIKVDPPNPQGPNPNVPAIRDRIFQAMATHVRGKGAYFGTFRRPQQ